MEDRRHALFKSEGLKDVCCSSGETDGGAEEGDAEVAHVDWYMSLCRVVGFGVLESIGFCLLSLLVVAVFGYEV